jgi:hypothetical protein
MAYQYHVAIENNFIRGPSPSYWTEKLADPILCGCIVLYQGGGDVQNYFPPGVIIPIDASDPSTVATIIRSLLQSNYYERHVDVLKEAQHLILERWGPYATIAEGLVRFGRTWE